MSTAKPAKRQRRTIDVGSDILEPRADFARDTLQVSERTAKRMGLPTTYIANVAYVARNAALKVVASRVRQANPPRRGGETA